MPNTHTTLDDLFSDIADAIRAKTGGSSIIIADDFPNTIEAIPTGGGLPAYLHHQTVTFAEDSRSVSIQTSDFRFCVITCDGDFGSETANTVFSGVIAYQNGAYVAGASRLTIQTSSGGVSYYTSNSGGGQAWTFADGVMTIANASGWLFAAGIQYDFFWF